MHVAAQSIPHTILMKAQQLWCVPFTLDSGLLLKPECLRCFGTILAFLD